MSARKWLGRGLVAALAAALALSIGLGPALGTATYPTGIKSFVSKNTGDIIQATDIDQAYDEITAVETGLISGFQHVLKPLTTSTYDLGTNTLLWRSEYLATTLFGSQGTITASAPFLNLTSTWNAGGVTFQGILENVTCTGCAAASTLIDLQKAGVSQFRVDQAGNATIAGSIVAPATVLNSGAVTVIPLTLKAVASQTGDLLLMQNSVPNTIFQFTSLASMVDGIQFNPSNTGNPATVSIACIGTDANCNLNLVSKGTGIVQVNGAPIAGTSVVLLLPTMANIPASGGATLVRADATSETWYELQHLNSGQSEETFEIPAKAFAGGLRITWRTTATTGNVKWFAEIREKGSADVLGSGTIISSGNVVSTAAGVASQLVEATISVSYTPGGSKRLALLRIYRNKGDGADTLAATAQLEYIEVLP